MTMFNVAGYTTSNQQLKLPLKLLPINKTSYTDKWAESTFKYDHLFDESLNKSRRQEGERNSNQWKAKAILAIHEMN